MNKLLIVCGPTATGKTALAVKLARHFDGELVSADSRQVYKGMDIGTGKDLPAKEHVRGLKLDVQAGGKSYALAAYDLEHVPVWLYDVVSPSEEFSVSLYQIIARAVIADIHKRGKLPVVVGGTGLYINSITNEMETTRVPPDKALRERLRHFSVGDLQTELKALSENVFEKLNKSDRGNPRRLIRKIELFKSPPAASAGRPSYDVYVVGLQASSDVLYDRIDSRVDDRVKEGVVGEIRSLLATGASWDLPAMSGLGYRQWKAYFDADDEDKETIQSKIISEWKFDEHGYARRQMTWFRRQKDIHWFDISDPKLLPEVTRRVTQWYT